MIFCSEKCVLDYIFSLAKYVDYEQYSSNNKQEFLEFIGLDKAYEMLVYRNYFELNEVMALYKNYATQEKGNFIDWFAKKEGFQIKGE
jgi:hypothetical protein